MLKSITLKCFINLLVGFAVFLFICASCSSQKSTVKKMLAEKAAFSEVGRNFSIVDYKEKKKTKWRLRTYEITGKVKFDDVVYTLLAELPQRTLHPQLMSVETFPAEVPFNSSIYKHRKRSSFVTVQLGKKLIPQKKLKKSIKNGIVIIDGKVAPASEANVKKTINSLLKQKKKIAGQYEDMKKQTAVFIDEFEKFSACNVFKMEHRARKKYLEEFEKKLERITQFMTQWKRFHDELAFARKEPWSAIIAYPQEISSLEEDIKAVIEKCKKQIDKASTLLKKQKKLHQGIEKGHYRILNVKILKDTSETAPNDTSRRLQIRTLDKQNKAVPPRSTSRRIRTLDKQNKAVPPRSTSRRLHIRTFDKKTEAKKTEATGRVLNIIRDIQID